MFNNGGRQHERASLPHVRPRFAHSASFRGNSGIHHMFSYMGGRMVDNQNTGGKITARRGEGCLKSGGGALKGGRRNMKASDIRRAAGDHVSKEEES
jgi:hypothetical protein